MKATPIFINLEFTGLHQFTTPISIALVDIHGKSFYGEFTDYDKSQVSPWVEENVIPQLLMTDPSLGVGADTLVVGTKGEVTSKLVKWLETYESIELWGDLYYYHMVLFDSLFGGGMYKPENISYITFDICTYLKVMGINPNIIREEFIGVGIPGKRHHALYEARRTRATYMELESLNNPVSYVAK